MRVRVPLVHTSAASVPKPVRVRVPAAQTLAGIEVMEEAIEVRDDPRDDEAVLVFALTSATTEEEAVATTVLVLLFTLAVPAVTAAASEVDAVCTSESVASEPEVKPAPVRVRVAYVQTSAAVSAPPLLMLEIAASMLVASVFPIEPTVVIVEVATCQTALGMPLIWDASEVDARLVFAFTRPTIDDDAIATTVLVLLFTLAVPAAMAEAREDVAVSTSDRVASEPDVKPAPVSVRVPLVHTSAARVPKPVRVRVPAAQTFVGIEVIDEAIEVRVEPSDVEAVFVLALTRPTMEDEAIATTVLVLLFTLAVPAVIAEPRDEVAV